jgi:DNA repair photolyase
MQKKTQLHPKQENKSVMAGKPVYSLPSHTSISWSDAFAHKNLTSGPVINLGDACVYACAYCYVEASSKGRFTGLLRGQGLDFQDVVIRRCGRSGAATAIDTLARQLAKKPWDGRSREFHTCFTSSTVDPAPNSELLEETARAIAVVLNETCWDVRVLSKSANLPRLAARVVELVPGAERHLILGVSTGTLDDNLGRAIERGTPLVSKRVKSLHELQDAGFRTFGMICPSLPQADYNAFSSAMCEAIRVEKCEHVWAEPINVRGASFRKTIHALEQAGFNAEAAGLRAVSGKGTKDAWDDYAKQTFLAHAANIPSEKLRFLHYPSKKSLPWWTAHQRDGAVLLGKLVLASG